MQWKKRNHCARAHLAVQLTSRLVLVDQVVVELISISCSYISRKRPVPLAHTKTDRQTDLINEVDQIKQADCDNQSASAATQPWDTARANKTRARLANWSWWASLMDRPTDESCV